MACPYRPIDWNHADPELYDLVDERCRTTLATGSLIEWNDLTQIAQDRIEQQVMREIEAEREASFYEPQIDAAEDDR